MRGRWLIWIPFLAIPLNIFAANAPRPTSTQGLVDPQVMGVCLDAVAPKLISNAARPKSATSRSRVLILPTSRKCDGFLTDNQLESELSATEWESAAPLAEAMRSRNTSAQPLVMPSSKQPARLMSSSELGFEPKDPWVEFYWPSYSTSGRTALVRAHFGPTPHGAVFTCLVTLEGMKWVVKWSEISYFA